MEEYGQIDEDETRNEYLSFSLIGNELKSVRNLFITTIGFYSLLLRSMLTDIYRLQNHNFVFLLICAEKKKSTINIY